MLCLAFVFFLCVGVCSAIGLSADSAVLYDPDTGEVAYEKNAHVRRGIASTTKIMTALVALEQYDIDRVVTIRPEWCYIEGSSIYLVPGEQLSVGTLLYGLMLESGNDAAVALAGILSGDTGDFVRLMNEKAAELGLENTSFENPNGLDGENHYSTAADMARITACALENEAFREIVSTRGLSVGTRYFSNHNRLLWSVEGAIGVKTGYTMKSGRCLVSAVTRDGRTLIAVTLGAPDDWDDHKGLYHMGFARFAPFTALSPGKVGEVPVVSGVSEYVSLYVDEGLSFGVTESEQGLFTYALSGRRFVYAPVTAGEKYGTLHVLFAGREVFCVDAYFGEPVAEQPYVPSFWERIWSDIRSFLSDLFT